MKPLLLSALLVAFPSAARADDFGDRSNTVTDALVTQLKKKAADITAADLATVTELKLPHIHLPAFKDDDFAGLPKLRKLTFFSLFHKVNPKPDEVPAFTAKVFANLPDLEELVILNDQLGTLPDDAFEGLKSLKVLELRNVQFAKLPASLLALPKIEAVYYIDVGGMQKANHEALKKTYGDKLKPKR